MVTLLLAAHSCVNLYLFLCLKDIFWNIGICLQACEVSQPSRPWSEHSVLYKSEISVRISTSVQFTGTFPTSFYILFLVRCMWELWRTKWYWDRLFLEHFRSSAISCMVFYYRRFGTTSRSHRQETKIRDCLTLEAGSVVLPDDEQRGSTKWVCFTLT